MKFHKTEIHHQFTVLKPKSTVSEMGKRSLRVLQFCLMLFCPLASKAEAVFAEPKELPVRVALPDPLIDNAGLKVTSADEWALRRREMLPILEHYAIGRMPPPPGNVTGHETDAQVLFDGKVTYRQVRLTFGPQQKLILDLVILIPKSPDARLPTIVLPSSKPIPVAGEQADEWARQFESPLSRGYAVVTFFYQQCAADQPDARQTGFFPAYPDYDWGTLAAWAWGMSRCVDFLETQPFADSTKFIALGHSRLGKAALIAGALDERFALTAPAGSGCGGTGAFRFNGKGRGGKEGLEDAVKRFPQWFVPRLAEFSGHVEKLPFDQHWLLALVAPRLLIAADGLDDPYANGNALAQSWLAAKPTYQLLGVPEHLGIHFRPGKHLLAPEDWLALLDFSEIHLFNRKIARDFETLPASDQLR